jgi:hypothetical protein
VDAGRNDPAGSGITIEAGEYLGPTVAVRRDPVREGDTIGHWRRQLSSERVRHVDEQDILSAWDLRTL